MTLAMDLRNKAEEIEMEAPRHVLRRLHSVIEIVDRESRRDTDAKAEEQGHHPRAPGVRRERRSRDLSTVEEPHVVRAAVADYAQLFFALQQRLVHLPVALGL